MMHQQPPSQQYNMPPGGGGQHYQGQQNPMGMMGQVNQGNHVMGQRPMPPYRPPQQGTRVKVCQDECWFFFSLLLPSEFLFPIPLNSLSIFISHRHLHARDLIFLYHPSITWPWESFKASSSEKESIPLSFSSYTASSTTPWIHLCVCCVYVYVGPPQQYPGQEDYYGDQYSHAGQGASEGRRTLQQHGDKKKIKQPKKPRSCVKTQMMPRDWNQIKDSSFFIIFWAIESDNCFK